MGLSTELMESSTELMESAGNDRGTSSRNWSLFGQVRLRKDWQDLAKTDPLLGRVTREESLWGVIVTMGIAGMRDGIMVNHDIEWYVLHFFCFWGAMSASVMYSTRFNDVDEFHSLLWTGFLLGMFGQVAFLDNSMRGFAGSTCFLYVLFAAANFRSAVYLPRARVFCGVFGSMCVLAALIFAVIASGLIPASSERALLRLHFFLEPVAVLIFVGFTTDPERKQRWDIPVSIEYLISRYEGFLMMIIVCSFLFPIGMSGASIAQSSAFAPPVVAILCANIYALLMKLVIFDIGFIHSGSSISGATERHAIRRSRFTAVVFIHTFAFGVLGIAFSGLGFVAAIKGQPITFTRKLLCGGASLTWGMKAVECALHQSESWRMHVAEVASLASCSLLFFFPWIAGMSQGPTLFCILLVMVFALISQVGIRAIMSEEGLPDGWHWRRPRLRLGQTVTSHEHFFTVFLAVCVFQLNVLVGKTHDLETYFLYFMIFYLVLQASMRYAARFNENDASHKLIWSLYQFGLLLMLEFLGTEKRRLYEAATAGVYTLCCVGFILRPAWHISRVRVFMVYYAVVSSVLVVILLCDCFCFNNTSSKFLLWMFVLVSGVADAAVIVLSWCSTDFSIPTSIEYIVSRFDGLFIEVLGVALIVPAAVAPTSYAHPSLVVAGDLLAALLAIVLKVGYFDVESVDFDKHAVLRAKWSAIIFVNLYPFTLFGLCMSGASLPLLITSAGTYGMMSQDVFAQRILCAATSLTWASLTVTKLLHKPASNLVVHHAKAFVQGMGSAACLLPLLWCHRSDISTLASVVAVNSVIVVTHFVLTSWGNAHIGSIRFDQATFGRADSDGSPGVSSDAYLQADAMRRIQRNGIC